MCPIIRSQPQFRFQSRSQFRFQSRSQFRFQSRSRLRSKYRYQCRPQSRSQSHSQFRSRFRLWWHPRSWGLGKPLRMYRCSCWISLSFFFLLMTNEKSLKFKLNRICDQKEAKSNFNRASVWKIDHIILSYMCQCWRQYKQIHVENYTKFGPPTLTVATATPKTT